MECAQPPGEVGKQVNCKTAAQAHAKVQTRRCCRGVSGVVVCKVSAESEGVPAGMPGEGQLVPKHRVKEKENQ